MASQETQQETQDQPPLWEYVTKLEKQGAAGGVWKFQCNLCSETRQGSYSRVRAHLLGIKGNRAIVLLKAVNCFGEVKDRFFIADLMKEVINEIGHQNVVQIITDNAANCKADGQLIESQFPHIYWTPCVVHTLNFAVKNICSPNNVETNALAYEQWQMFTPLILLSVAGTRFASITVMLKRLKLIKTGLQAMVISEEWSSYRDDDTVKANFVKEKIVNDDMGRDKVSYILSFTGPIYEMIKACDTDKPCLHLVYEMWDSMIEKVKIEIYKKEKRSISQKSLFYDVVHGILVARWAKNNTPLHCLAHSLNPRYYSDAWLLEDSTRSAPHRDAEISQERINCFRRLFPNDDEHSKVLDEYAMFSYDEEWIFF
ncbi:hAT dimerization domain, ribonuclease H-like domain protein [Tanacetum coccineum]